MPKSDIVRVRHALEAAREAIGFLGTSDVSELEADRQKGYAVVFALATVGEALNAVSKGWQDQHPEIPWREAISLRHRLIHGYHDIKWDRVWQTVRDDIPSLIEALERSLGGEE